MDKSFYLKYLSDAIATLDGHMARFEKSESPGMKTLAGMFRENRSRLDQEYLAAIKLPEDTDWIARFKEKIPEVAGRRLP